TYSCKIRSLPWMRCKEKGSGSLACRHSALGKAQLALARPLWVKSRHLQRKKACPLYPRKRTYAVQLGMSARGQKRTSIIFQSAVACRVKRGPRVPLTGPQGDDG